MPKLLKHVYREYVRTEQKINQAESTIKHTAEHHQEFLEERMKHSKPAKEIDRIRKIIQSK